MRCVYALINDETYPLTTNQGQHDPESNKSSPGAPV